MQLAYTRVGSILSVGEMAVLATFNRAGSGKVLGHGSYRLRSELAMREAFDVRNNKLSSQRGVFAHSATNSCLLHLAEVSVLETFY